MHLTVITRKVSPSITKCELVCNDRVPISYDRTVFQHDNYVRQFNRPTKEEDNEESNITVIELEALPNFADSMFVEDTCVVFDDCAVITRPGADSRRGEVEHIKSAVSSVRSKVFQMQEPALCDGGDVLLVGKHLFVGQSSRTNEEAVKQFKQFVENLGYDIHAVDLRRDRPGKKVQQDCMHLKCAATKLDEKTVLINPNWIPAEIFSKVGLRVVEIPVAVAPDEQDGANVLSYKTSELTRSIVVSSFYPKTFQFLQEFYQSAKSDDGKVGVTVTKLEVDEIAKAEGALTCCSLLCYH